MRAVLGSRAGICFHIRAGSLTIGGLMVLSVVIPLLNEQDNLKPLHARLREVFSRLGCRGQIVFVDDGSTDASVRVMAEIARLDPDVKGIRFSRNFGHEAASTAGLDAAEGDAVVLMDADLQDPPELIEQMVGKWREGNQIVYARRRKRDGESAYKRFTSWLFYRVLSALSDVDIPRDVGDFRLIDRSVVDALKQCRERDRFVRGLVAWTGFTSTAVEYDRPERAGGETKYNTLKLLWLSLDAAVGFSILPLRAASALGFAVMAGSMVLVCVLIVQKLTHHMDTISGYALLTAGLFFFGGVQMLLLGILGEYIGRVYRQSQGRPLYIVREVIAGGMTNSQARNPNQ